MLENKLLCSYADCIYYLRFTSSTICDMNATYKYQLLEGVLAVTRENSVIFVIFLVALKSVLTSAYAQRCSRIFCIKP